MTSNCPSGLAQLYRFASSSSEGSTAEKKSSASLEERIQNAALMREAGLKCAVVVGAPRVSEKAGERAI